MVALLFFKQAFSISKPTKKHQITSETVRLCHACLPGGRFALKFAERRRIGRW